jgi:CRISPR/Cas system-associated exonuclease Cas4 (RecB family)
MEYFLDTIAGSLYNEFGNNLNRHCLVFPNRRAGLFFLKHLASQIEKPVWEPYVLTINELFQSHSSLQTTGNEILLFELYKVYRKLKKSAESFDNFYFWGDILINDFDDIDKYLVDASQLFRNVLDIKNIDTQFSSLTEEQKKIIRQFWINFEPEKPTDQKNDFIGIWSIMYEIYRAFRYSLESKKTAYEGMIFRDLAERENELFSTGDRWDIIHFIGFNALNECEKRIMLRLKKSGRARFYWDYDESYISGNGTNSAGYFMRGNLKLFGNDMPPEWNPATLLSSTGKAVRRRIIDTSSDVAQVKLVNGLLQEIPGLTPENAHQTAIVLADENLLVPMLSSLPENMGDINITMGYPLKQTHAYSLVKSIIELQRNARISDGKVIFTYNDVTSILSNSLISSFICHSAEKILDDIRSSNMLMVSASYFSEDSDLNKIFIRPETPAAVSEYLRNILTTIAINVQQKSDEEGNKAYNKILNEFIYRIVLSVNKLETMVKSEDVSFTSETYLRILDRLLRVQSVPFAGEPLSGIQIMGILETRALDFKNLIILSVNEGVLPSVSSLSSSYIPFSLRDAFGLPSVNHQESIYAYHFYRLLHRAENVIFTYNSNPDGLRTGEMSRFLIQLKYDKFLKPEAINLHMEIKSRGSISELIERTDAHNRQLIMQYDDNEGNRILSPSAVNTWLNCRMKFYYRYVNRLKEPLEVKHEIDPAMLGEVLHEIMKSFYTDYEGRLLSREYLGSLLSDNQIISEHIGASIRKRFKGDHNDTEHGNEFIVREVLFTYLKRILNIDFSISPLKIVSLEKKYSFPMNLSSEAIAHNLILGGVVDRVDVHRGVTRIVDYKTGSVAETIGSISDLFADDRKKDIDGWLQTLLYCEALSVSDSADILRPSIYKIKKSNADNHSDKLRIRIGTRQEIQIENYNEVRSEFLEGLKNIISLIFSPDEPFRMTTDRNGKCKYCVYRSLCIR